MRDLVERFTLDDLLDRNAEMRVLRPLLRQVSATAWLPWSAIGLEALEPDFRRLWEESQTLQPSAAQLMESVLRCIVIEIARRCTPPGDDRARGQDADAALELQNRRLRFARSLLVSTDLGVTEVCHAAGLNSRSHFGRASDGGSGPLRPRG